jgi:hypothetical protein
MPLYRSCLSVFLVTSVLRRRSKRLSGKDAGQAAKLLDRPLLPGLPPLTMAQLRKAALPIKDGGLGHTVPSDVVQPAYLGSRLDTVDAVAALPRMRDAVVAMQDCSTLLAHHVAANQVPIISMSRRDCSSCSFADVSFIARELRPSEISAAKVWTGNAVARAFSFSAAAEL